MALTTQPPWDLWQKAIYDWLTSVGLQVVMARQHTNPPTLRKPYVLVDLFNIDVVGFDSKQYQSEELVPNDGRVIATLSGLRELSISLQVVSTATGRFDDGAMQWADRIISSLSNDDTYDPLRQAGLSVVSVGRANDISAIEQAQFISRVNIDLTIEAAFFMSLGTAKHIERVIGEGDVEGNSVPELLFDVTGPQNP